MKALLISDDSEILQALEKFFLGKSFDTIKYRWLLKALDNVEEIQPDCIVLSSSEYPRHWKTLVQFVKSGIGGDRIAFFLYEPTPVSEADKEKIKLLGINGCFTSLDQASLDELSKKIDDFFEKDEETAAEPEEPLTVEEPQVQMNDSEIFDEELSSDLISVDMLLNQRDSSGLESAEGETKQAMKGTGFFAFTNPYDEQLVTGEYFDFNQRTMLCKADNADDEVLFKESLLQQFSYNAENENRTTDARITDVLSINDDYVMVIELV